MVAELMECFLLTKRLVWFLSFFCKAGSQESPTGYLTFQTMRLHSSVQTDTVGHFVKLCVVRRILRVLNFSCVAAEIKPLNSLWSSDACLISGCPHFQRSNVDKSNIELYWNCQHFFFFFPTHRPPSHPSPAPHLSVSGRLQVEERSVHCAECTREQLHTRQVGHQRERHGGHGSQDAGKGSANKL